MPRRRTCGRMPHGLHPCDCQPVQMSCRAEGGAAQNRPNSTAAGVAGCYWRREQQSRTIGNGSGRFAAIAPKCAATPGCCLPGSTAASSGTAANCTRSCSPGDRDLWAWADERRAELERQGWRSAEVRGEGHKAGRPSVRPATSQPTGARISLASRGLGAILPAIHPPVTRRYKPTGDIPRADQAP